MRFDRNLFHRQNRRRRTVIITQSARYYNKRKTASLRLLIIVRYTNTLTYLLTYTEWQANCPNTYKTFIANINIRSRFFSAHRSQQYRSSAIYLTAVSAAPRLNDNNTNDPLTGGASGLLPASAMIRVSRPHLSIIIVQLLGNDSRRRFNRRIQ